MFLKYLSKMEHGFDHPILCTTGAIYVVVKREPETLIFDRIELKLYFV